MALRSGFSLRRFLVVVIVQGVLIAILFSQTSESGATWPYVLLVLSTLVVAVAYAMRPGESAILRAQELEEETESLQEMVALHQSRLGSLLDSLATGVVLVNTDGDVLISNPAMQTLFALSDEESRATTLPHLVRHYQFVDLWRRTMERNAAQTLMAEVPQSKRVLRATVFPLSNEMDQHYLLLFEDVSDLRRLETIRKDFVSNVSHELRTPLTSIKALTESLRAGALDEPEMARRFLGHIETEVDALSELVSELLELARIESQQVPLQRSPSDACEILQRGAERLRTQAERAGLELRIECQPRLPLVLADAPRLEQVLVNLIHNAIKFTPRGGSISVTAVAKNTAVEFSVTDTGVGISTDNLQRVFERFYKADPARNKSGTGLGLAVAKHLVEAHEGHIGVESAEGRGSRFYLTIPTVVNPVAKDN